MSTSSFEVEVIPALGAVSDFDDLAQRLGCYLDPTEITFRSVSRLNLLPSMKIGATHTQLATPDLP